MWGLTPGRTQVHARSGRIRVLQIHIGRMVLAALLAKTAQRPPNATRSSGADLNPSGSGRDACAFAERDADAFVDVDEHVVADFERDGERIADRIGEAPCLGGAGDLEGQLVNCERPQRFDHAVLHRASEGEVVVGRDDLAAKLAGYLGRPVYGELRLTVLAVVPVDRREPRKVIVTRRTDRMPAISAGSGDVSRACSLGPSTPVYSRVARWAVQPSARSSASVPFPKNRSGGKG